MQILGEFIKDNKSTIESLFKVGEISTTLILKYEMYLFYNSLANSMPKMQKYSVASEKFNVSEKTIQTALKTMRKVIK